MLGSNGEAAFLSKEEKLGLLKAAKGAIAPGQLLIAGMRQNTKLDDSFGGTYDLNDYPYIFYLPLLLSSNLIRNGNGVRLRNYSLHQ